MNPELLDSIYRYICDYLEQFGYAPSLREISRGCYLSQANVYRYLDRLEMQGRLTRDPGRARSIKLKQPCPKG